jgi:two-component system, NtrC family, response regulator AtoC
VPKDDRDALETSSVVLHAASPHGETRFILLTSSVAGVVATPLEEGRPVVLGRAGGSDVTIDDASVSRQHARVRASTAHLEVTDLGSKNGVVVGGRKIASGACVPLRPGEVMALGAVSVVILRADGVVATPVLAEPASAERPAAPAARASGVVLEAPGMKRLVALLERIAKSPLSVLLSGESGTGKEVLARLVHDASPRRQAPFVALNCAALPETMLESELFGYDKGAFTGAAKDKPGLFELADGGTIFLDELGELPQAMQAKLLRVLESGEVRRLGGLTAKRVDARVVAATNADLASAVAEGRFRGDLFYRVNGMSFALPPLRERREDVEPLATMFLTAACRRAGRAELTLADDAKEAIARHDWPGNARELRNVMERAAAIAEGSEVRSADLFLDTAPKADGATHTKPRSDVADEATMRGWEATERERVKEALARARGNRTRAARALGISRHTLLRRIAALGLDRADDE